MQPSLRASFVALRSPLLLLLGALSLYGCSSTNSKTPIVDAPSESVSLTLATDAPLDTPPPTPKAAPSKPIPVDTLYSLLLAEMAGQRQQYDVALEHYIWQAKQTRDPDIAERAARIAQFLGNQTRTAETLDIWLEEDPDNPDAHQTAAQLLMELGDFQRAVFHLERVQQLSGTSQYDYLASNAGNLTHEQKVALLSELQRIQNEQPNNASAVFAVGIMHQQLGQYDQALESMNRTLKLQPDLLAANLQKARVLSLLNKHNDALRLLTDLRKKHPNNKGVQVLRARILLEQQNLEAARIAFVELNKQFPDDSAILLSKALLNDETGRKEEARSDFYQLLASGEHTNEAHFYLGRIADDENDINDAINHLSQVRSGREFLPAQLRAAFLIHDSQNLEASREYLHDMREQHPRYALELLRIEVELLLEDEEYDTAYQLLTDALKQSPRNIELLYTRAMLAERQQNITALELDLRAILAINPDHIDSLNALGYALADRTDRWSEALPLIERALALAPNNPAIIDSLGWVYFRMGKFEQALPLLEQAFNVIEDHEIAAHLGELLWITGNKQRAILVWTKGLNQNPNSDVIQRTLKRLQVPEDEFTKARP